MYYSPESKQDLTSSVILYESIETDIVCIHD
jgi:hypothetical protein